MNNYFISLMTFGVTLRFTSTRRHSMDEIICTGSLFADRGSRQKLQVLVPSYVGDGLASISEEPAPERHPQPILPTPTDVPVPEPHDVPVPEPIDVPPPKPTDVPPPNPSKPDYDPRPRSIP